MNDVPLEQVCLLARQAGRAILDVYERGELTVTTKADASPLTEADIQSHTIIEEGLQSLTPEIPILSEESSEIQMDVRLGWDRFWLVDPLDGTKEFIKRNGEFTVNIALIEHGLPIFGVVLAPVFSRTYFGGVDVPSRCEDKQGSRPIQCASLRDPMKVVTSRSHPSEECAAYLSSLGPHECVPMGSSLKICLVAEGAADIYPRLGPTMEWDTAAAHAVVIGAGGSLTRFDGTPLVYNKPDLLNPHFIVSNGELPF